ncbi:hypothetical protein KJS94_02940 [Flavihumibacter rivuli]|uniref:hypothetical protein n=1 Tax=Flavihumibacter rivuli TaxID=2838156 RepID=UPI001BDE47E9|nr:hypothetical protein [Flavihumibacter rivuli]ULQ57153.1 hypothetical protein KJS94_02940 [Flavihumibacter rivuli]
MTNNISIVSKTYAKRIRINKSSDIDISYCQGESTSINSVDNCIIQNSDTVKYLRRSTLIFDSLGQISKFLQYHPEGILSYSKKDLLQDTAIIEEIYINLKRSNSIAIDLNHEKIIDNGDTLKIYDHWEIQKFIFVTSTRTNKKKSNNLDSDYTIIYAYE